MQIQRITFAEPGLVRFESLEADLVIIKSTEIIVKTCYSLVSAGTELACLGGAEWWFPLPNIPGYAAVGKVVSVGSAVTKVACGDLVLTHGPHSSLFKIDTTDRYTGTCVPLPSGLAVELAPFARMASIAITAIRVANIEAGDNVLVTGLGLIGNLVAQLAAIQGARVICVELSERRRACAQACGIAHTIDAARPDWKESARQIAGRRGITTYIDATGISSVIKDASTQIAHNGEAILLGTPRKPYETDITELFRNIHLPAYTTFKGALEWRFPTFREEYTKHSVERNSEIILELAAAGRLSFGPLLTHKIPPDQAREIYTNLLSQKDDSYLGVVFDWNV